MTGKKHVIRSQFSTANRSKVTKMLKTKKVLNQFLNNSSFHSVQIIGDSRRMNIERFFWFFVFIISSLCSVFFINSIWLHWQQTKIVLVQSNQISFSTEVPHPQFTVCSNIKLSTSIIKLSKVIQQIDNNTIANLTVRSYGWDILRETIAMMCPRVKKITQFATAEYINKTMIDALFSFRTGKKLSPSHSSPFQAVLLPHGICFSQNRLSLDDFLRDDV